MVSGQLQRRNSERRSERKLFFYSTVLIALNEPTTESRQPIPDSRQPIPDNRFPTTMTFDYLLGGIVAIALLAYLIWTLIRPERF